MKNTDQWLGLVYVQISLAVFVALLGIATTLSVSVVDRRREFAIVRAIGGLAHQVRRSVLVEAVVVAVLGLVLGVVFGMIDLFYELELVRRYYAGMTLDYRFPFSLMFILCPMMIVASIISALVPSESARRSPVVEGLGYE